MWPLCVTSGLPNVPRRWLRHRQKHARGKEGWEKGRKEEQKKGRTEERKKGRKEEGKKGLCQPLAWDRQAHLQLGLLAGPRVSWLWSCWPCSTVTGTPWRAARPPGSHCAARPQEAPPAGGTSYSICRVHVLTAPRGLSIASGTGWVPVLHPGTRVLLVLVGSPGKDSASPQPPLHILQNSPASAPTAAACCQLPAAHG